MAKERSRQSGASGNARGAASNQDRTPSLLARKLLEWFCSHARPLPWRRTRDPYAIWISEVMLQQTQVKTVIPYWTRWMKELPTVQALAAAAPEKVLKLWEGLGYYSRARNLQRAAHAVMTRHAGRFPESFADVLALPGIGRYTAGAICSIAFGQSVAAVDGNIMRVLCRLFGLPGDPRSGPTHERLWQLAAALVTAAAAVVPPLRQPVPPSSLLNQSLMELGATVCTPCQPSCPACPMHLHCVALRDASVHRLPERAPRVASIHRHRLAFVVQRQGRYLVCQRPEQGINAHLWEFPSVELATPRRATSRSAETSARQLRASARRLLGFMPASLQPLVQFRHSITRYRIRLESFLLDDYQGECTFRGGRWLTLAEMHPLPFSSAHARILVSLAASVHG